MSLVFYLIVPMVLEMHSSLISSCIDVLMKKE